MKARCQCGNLNARITDSAEAMTVVCHCIDCQRRSGSPFGVMAYFDADAVTLSGVAKEYTRATDTGSTFTTGFCSNCGSTVYSRPGKFPGMIGIAIGAIADPSQPPPLHSVYEQSRHPWVSLPETMPGHQQGRET